jgi:peptidoglycan hydrolase-like protein with peptidoglycan-binding domain
MANVPTETPVGPTPPPVTVPPAVNTRLLVERAQKALTRVSCYDGDADGSFGPKTVSALERYLKAKDDDTTAPEVTEPLVARLEAEPRRRVCPLICPSGQRVSRNGSRCERIASEPRSPRGSGGSATGPNAPRPTGGNGGSGARPTPPSPPPAAPQPPRIGVIIGGG